MYLYDNVSTNGDYTTMTIDSIISSNTARIDRYTMYMNNMLKDYVDLQNNPYYLNLEKLKLLL